MLCLVPHTKAEEDDEKEALIAAILAAYTFTQADIDRMALLLTDAYVAAMQRAARRGQVIVGAASTWEVSESFRRAASQYATISAEGIAATFLRLLESFLRRSSFATMRETLTGIVVWIRNTIKWKVPQIVSMTIGLGNDAGTGAIVQALLDGDLIDLEDPELIIGAEGYAFEVIPANSISHDLCAEYAGQRFPLSEWDQVPAFPIHPHCIHSRVLVPA